MRRLKLTIEYEGTAFVGWQFQINGLSVQGVLEHALSQLTPHTIGRIEGSGRTDAGVHAQGQVAHVDVLTDLPTFKIRQGMNFYLRFHPVVVLNCEEVAPDFHARFSARRRCYRYRLLNRPSGSALDRHRVWWVPIPLHLEAMQQAALDFIGRHDFSSFRASDCQARHAIRTLEAFTVSQQGEEIWFDVQARSFLHHQVRIMVGTLKAIGEGRWPHTFVQTALAARCRTQSGPTAPASGLYFQSVQYDV